MMRGKVCIMHVVFERVLAFPLFPITPCDTFLLLLLLGMNNSVMFYLSSMLKLDINLEHTLRNIDNKLS